VNFVDVVELISTSHDGTMSLRSLKRNSDTSNHGSRTPASVTGSALPLPNPFKAMKTYLEKPHLHDADQGCGWSSIADDGYTLGILCPGEAVLGVRMRHVANQIVGLAWSHSCIKVCMFSDLRIFSNSARDSCVRGVTSGSSSRSPCRALWKRTGLTLTYIMWFMTWVGMQSCGFRVLITLVLRAESSTTRSKL